MEGRREASVRSLSAAAARGSSRGQDGGAAAGEAELFCAEVATGAALKGEADVEGRREGVVREIGGGAGAEIGWTSASADCGAYRYLLAGDAGRIKGTPPAPGVVRRSDD